MKKVCFVWLMFLCCLSAASQNLIEIKEKAFNWGGKVGLNAAFPIINSLTIDEVEMENISLQYKVGFQAAVFARVNISRFYIQPSLGWQYTEGDIRFSHPLPENGTNNLPDMVAPNLPLDDQITYKAATLEMPIMIGYYLVKENPYALSIQFGPAFKYNYKVRYNTNLTDQPREFADENTPFGICFVAGVGVSIGRLFFDFNYEFGLNEIASDFREIKNNTSPDSENGALRIDKRTNILNFSLGVLF